MIATGPYDRGRDGRLWAIALVLSLVANAGFLGVVSLEALVIRPTTPGRPVTVPPAETTVTIFPDMISRTAAVAKVPEPALSGRARAVRTSEDQRADKPENPSFIGERNTRATSDRAPDAAAPPLPSQAGDRPKNEDDFETTASDYQEGKLPEQSVSTANAEPPPRSVPAAPPAGEAAARPGADSQQAAALPRQPLMEGPNPVETPVPRKPAEEQLKPTPSLQPRQGEPEKTAAGKPRETAKPEPAAKDPAFKGFQRKTAIRGSISRNGRSALDVEDTPLGRYQAQISRAVEQEWQRNCVRHRDFITPGFLTVRFFVEASGRVRSVQFAGDMETGEVQKGFTLNSIRDADIPAMPASLRKEYDAEPLELIFNFYF